MEFVEGDSIEMVNETGLETARTIRYGSSLFTGNAGPNKGSKGCHKGGGRFWHQGCHQSALGTANGSYLRKERMPVVNFDAL